MTTSTAEIPAAFNMQERKAPKQIRFAVGDVIEGVFVSLRIVEVGDPNDPNRPKNKTSQFTLADGEVREGKFVLNGERVTFLGTYDLNQKLRAGDRGHFVSVRCEGEDSSFGKNGNAMKRFKVLISEKPVELPENELVITDDDIPF